MPWRGRPRRRGELEEILAICRRVPLAPPETFREAVQALWTVKTAVELAHPMNLHCFGRLDQTTVGLTTRVDFSFTPALSVQVYANPFVTAGDYESFRRVADPRASTYASRFAALDAVRTEGGGVEADVDGDGIPESLGTPDFNLRLFNSNVVLRWEYRPGSALFLVWSQARSHTDETGAFDLDGDARVLFGAPATNVFLVKFSYWLSP